MPASLHNLESPRSDPVKDAIMEQRNQQQQGSSLRAAFGATPNALPQIATPSINPSSMSQTAGQAVLSNASPHNRTAIPTAVPSPSTSIHGRPPTRLSLSNLMDLSALDSTRFADTNSTSDQNEQFDFDTLWAWPTNTPAAGTPGPDNMQGISDSAVPLFGVMDG
ncbi:hypothetical protein LTS18_000933 [Coniosporium uncinatum]|uniref:Uncharacterized protein n=1 Tax=Coniosporium uncinatum TaxID=93489 RepID=A0ACC3DF75_9PEZI|nr:hypothetical protein LTS18_000933 [Coniosporium uncinatum]